MSQEKKNNIDIIEWGMRHKAVPLSAAFVLVVLGLFALFNMPRDEFPDFTIRQGLIVGVYPGASADQVEDRLTSQMEEYLFSYDEVDKTKTYSYSRDGMMYIYVEVNGYVNHSDTEAFWNKLKHGVLQLQETELPREVQGIMVNSDFGSTAALILSVESKTRPYKELQKHVEDIEDDLRRMEDVSKISRSGDMRQQVAVYIDHDKMVQYGINAAMIMQKLQEEGAVSPAGALDGDIVDRPIHMTTFFKNETDLAQQIIRSDGVGNVIRLKDIATIRREYEDPDSYIQTNGTKSIIITMEMAEGKNIVQFGEEVDQHLEALQRELPADIRITKIANQPHVVHEAVSHFMREFAYALIGVIIVTMLLLPFRIAAVAASTIPITISCTLAIMYLAGMELNTVTLAALVVVLGIVVDDPIVVIDNYVEKLDEGQSIWNAAKNSAKELFPSVFTATLAIIFTFYPLVFFTTGISYDFIESFPFTIMIALLLSLIISMVLVPFFNTVFIKTGLKKNDGEKEEGDTEDKKSMLEKIQGFFNTNVRKAVEHWKLTLGIGAASIILGGFLIGSMTQEFLPYVERNQFSIEIYLAKGYNLDQTEKVVRGMEEVLAKDNRVVNYTSFVGTSSPRFHTVYAPNLPSQDYAQILVTTTSNETTEEILDEYEEKYGDAFPEAHVRMKQLDMLDKPAPIEIRFFGDDIATLKNLGRQVIDMTKDTPDIIWARTNYKEEQRGITLDIKTDQAGRLGLSKNDIANTVAMNMEGLNATQIWDGDYDINVKVKTDNTHTHEISDLRELSVIVPERRTIIPLRQVADVTPDWHEGQIVHRNGIRCLTVRIDIAQGAVGDDILTSLDSKISKLDVPDGYYYNYGGEYEMQKEQEKPLGLALGLSVVVIFLILIWHFKTFKHALLSFAPAPLSLLGAPIGLILMGYPFGLTSFMGLLALCGIVVRNGIILIDYANHLHREEGVTAREAAIRASERRMRPIFLTSSAAAVGVIPMIISRSPLWGPLGTVICFGLMISMVLTLFVLPALYWVLFRKDDQSDSLDASAAVNNR